MEWTVKNFQKSRRKTDSVFTVGFVIILLLFGLSPYQNWIVRSSNKRSEDNEIKQNKDWKKSRRNKEGRKSAQSKERKIQKRKRFTKIKNKKTDSEMKVRGFKATDPDNSRAPADKESKKKSSATTTQSRSAAAEEQDSLQLGGCLCHLYGDAVGVCRRFHQVGRLGGRNQK